MRIPSGFVQTQHIRARVQRGKAAAGRLPCCLWSLAPVASHRGRSHVSF